MGMNKPFVILSLSFHHEAECLEPTNIAKLLLVSLLHFFADSHFLMMFCYISQEAEVLDEAFDILKSFGIKVQKPSDFKKENEKESK